MRIFKLSKQILGVSFEEREFYLHKNMVIFYFQNVFTCIRFCLDTLFAVPVQTPVLETRTTNIIGSYHRRTRASSILVNCRAQKTLPWVTSSARTRYSDGVLGEMRVFSSLVNIISHG